MTVLYLEVLRRTSSGTWHWIGYTLVQDSDDVDPVDESLGREAAEMLDRLILATKSMLSDALDAAQLAEASRHPEAAKSEDPEAD